MLPRHNINVAEIFAFPGWMLLHIVRIMYASEYVAFLQIVDADLAERHLIEQSRTGKISRHLNAASPSVRILIYALIHRAAVNAPEWELVKGKARSCCALTSGSIL